MKTYICSKRALPTCLRAVRPFGTLLLSMLLFVTPVSAGTIVLTFDEQTIPDSLQCNGSWSEAGLEMTILPLDTAICGLGFCQFVRRPNHLDLLGAFLDIDLTSITGTVISAELHVASPGSFTNAIFFFGNTVVDSDSGGLPPGVNRPDTLRIFTSGMPVDRLAVNSCLEMSLSEIRIEVDDVPSGVTPSVTTRVLRLESSPNPFDTSTRISFELETSGRATLAIYDVRGRLVRSLVDSDLAARRWTASWDGRDASGRRLATGVYFARLAVNGRVAATGKVVIVR